MRNIKYLFFFLSFTLLWSCTNDDAELGDILAPSNIQYTVDIVGQDAANPFGDGTGVVNVVASANNAISYKYIYDGKELNTVSGIAQLILSNVGVNVYDVTLVAYGAGGVSSSTSFQIEVSATYTAPEDLLDKLVGNGSVTWRIKQEKACHFGLGPVGGGIPCEWYGAQPFEKSVVGMYDDRYIFDQDGTFTHITNNTNDDPNQDSSGTVFGRDGLISEIGSGGELDGADVLNLPYSDYTGTWQLIAPGGQETILLSGTSFIGYYTGGNHQYQIADRGIENELIISTVDGNGEFTWWFTLTSDANIESGDPVYENLIWSEEFEGDALNSSNWKYEYGAGGWGNNESQHYTDRPENVSVSDGTLKITAVKENFENSQYTSARLISDDLFEFTYGKVEISAKMAGGGGTWPALWMLGENLDQVGWPAAGEIDIVEYVGNNPNVASAAMHWPGNSGGDAPNASTSVANAETEFHLYECYWSPDVVRMLVDGNEYFSVQLDDSMPFNQDFFFILNVAMGGTLGGDIDPEFTSSTMEVDYIRVFQ